VGGGQKAVVPISGKNNEREPGELDINVKLATFV
jgi:hypothetical protein